MRRHGLLMFTTVLSVAQFACDGDGEDDLLSVAEGEVHAEVSLPLSNFEIDVDANLKVDDVSPSIDWASVTETRQADLASGGGDDSFGQGSKEDTPVPVVVDGSIPPNKSDLLTFGVYLETTATKKFLHLYWHRVQEPSGTRTWTSSSISRRRCRVTA